MVYKGLGLSKQVVCLILTMFFVKLYIKAIRCEVSSKLKELKGIV